jgi:carboxylesterase
MDQTEHSLVNPELPKGTFLLPGSPICIILFHGFTATTVEVKELAEYIHEQKNFTVACPLLPGHGTNPVDLANTKFQEWVNAAETAFEAYSSTSEQIFVGGESMGGLLALYLAAKHPRIAGVMLYSPALIIPGLVKANNFRHFIFSTPKRNIDSPTAPGCLPWQGYKENPLNAVVELGKLQTLVRSQLREIEQPTIIFQGELDKTINPVGSRIIYESISSRLKQFVPLKNSGHCVLLEVEYLKVYQESIEFLSRFT